MNFIDAHLHLRALDSFTLDEMYMAGIREVISPIMLGPAKFGEGISSDTIIDMWNHLLEVRFKKIKDHFIKGYGMIGITMVSTPRDGLDRLLKLLPEYLNRPDVVAIGEIGFQPGSPTCSDIKKQEEILCKQLEIAKNIDIVVDIHTPNPPEQKIKYTKRSLELCKESGLSMSKVVIDHCSDDTLKIVLEAGAYAAISVQPWRKINAELGADLVLKYGFEKIMLDSDTCGMPSDCLAVPKTAMNLKKKGISDENIEKVCWSNCRKAYGIDKL